MLHYRRKLEVQRVPGGRRPAGEVTVNSTGTVDRGGNALISGTVNCTGFIPNPGSVTGTVRQVYKRINSITANFTATSGCSSTHA
jgi:hypothetical protein